MRKVAKYYERYRRKFRQSLHIIQKLNVILTHHIRVYRYKIEVDAFTFREFNGFTSILDGLNAQRI